MTRKFLKNILALFLGLLLAFFVAEIFLRIYNPFPATVKGDKVLLRANTRIVYSKPDANAKLIEHTVTTNKLGFRGADPPQKSEEYFRIITIGGSTTQCLYSSDSTTWTAYLEKELKPAIKNLWINNAGLAGHTTYGHKILLEDYIVNLKPNVAIFLFGVNDVGVVRDTAIFSLYAQDNQNSFLKWIKTTLYKSEAVGVGVNLYRYLKANKQSLKYDYNFNIKTAPHIILTAAESNKIYNENIVGLPDYISRVNAIADICLVNKITPVFVTQPSLYANAVDASTGVNLATVKIGNRSGLLCYYLLEAYNNVMRKVATEKKIFLIDLAQQLPHDSKYYYDFIHYNDEGNKKIAEIMSAQLKEYLKINRITSSSD